jgi:hypothetical protein
MNRPNSPAARATVTVPGVAGKGGAAVRGVRRDRSQGLHRAAASAHHPGVSMSRPNGRAVSVPGVAGGCRVVVRGVGRRSQWLYRVEGGVFRVGRAGSMNRPNGRGACVAVSVPGVAGGCRVVVWGVGCDRCQWLYRVEGGVLRVGRAGSMNRPRGGAVRVAVRLPGVAGGCGAAVRGFRRDPLRGPHRAASGAHHRGVSTSRPHGRAARFEVSVSGIAGGSGAVRREPLRPTAASARHRGESMILRNGLATRTTVTVPGVAGERDAVGRKSWRKRTLRSRRIVASALWAHEASMVSVVLVRAGQFAAARRAAPSAHRRDGHSARAAVTVPASLVSVVPRFEGAGAMGLSDLTAQRPFERVGRCR